LTDREFACEPDANTDLVAFLKTHSKSFFSVSLSAVASVNEKNPVGRPSAKPKPKQIEVVWAVSAGQIIPNEGKIERQRQKDESFCLLTNIDPDTLGSREVLLRYKAQHKVEILPFDLLVYVPCHRNSIGGANVPGNLERIPIDL